MINQSTLKTYINNRLWLVLLLSIKDMAHLRDKELLKKIVALKKENEELEDLNNFLLKENFEYALKCNRIQNTLESIESRIKTSPQSLLGLTTNISNILNECAIQKSVRTERSSLSPYPIKPNVQATSPNKAHAVKPHMVNGHVLFVPTINLTRVNERNIRENKLENNDQETGGDVPSTSHVAGNFCRDGEQEPAEQDSTLVPHIDEPQPSTSSQSPSHSTLLSGTFQEVKIYLSPIGVTKRRRRT